MSSDRPGSRYMYMYTALPIVHVYVRVVCVSSESSVLMNMYCPRVHTTYMYSTCMYTAWSVTFTSVEERVL